MSRAAGLDSLRGAPFPGGTSRIEPYENALMHDAVRSPRSPLPHPIWVFVAAQRGMGLTLGELFEWFDCPASDGPLLGECALEFRAPLRVGTDYQVSGRVLDVQRKRGRTLGAFDLVTCGLDLNSGDTAEPDASIRYGMILPKGGRPVASPGVPAPAASRAGQRLPPWEVGEQEMKLLALLLRDPNPIHIDAAEVTRLGLGDRPVNQGPANLAYIITMLQAAEPGRVLRSLRARLHGHVLAGQRVVAGGALTAAGDDERCYQVWLDRADGGGVVTGAAVLSAGWSAGLCAEPGRDGAGERLC